MSNSERTCCILKPRNEFSCSLALFVKIRRQTCRWLLASFLVYSAEISACMSTTVLVGKIKPPIAFCFWTWDFFKKTCFNSYHFIGIFSFPVSFCTVLTCGLFTVCLQFFLKFCVVYCTVSIIPFRLIPSVFFAHNTTVLSLCLFC